MPRQSIPFLDLFMKYCEHSFGKENGIKIYTYFLEKSNFISTTIKCGEILNEDCFMEVRYILQQMEADIFKNDIPVYYVTCPYEAHTFNRVSFKDFLKNIYDLYAEKGHPSHGQLRSTRLEFDIKIVEILAAKNLGNDQDIFNLGYISTPYSRKMNQIFKSFREGYGKNYRNISQKNFLDYVNQKIEKEISDHSLRHLWKSFYSEEIELPLKENNL